MSDIQYKCPSCSAPIEFDPTSGRMVCAFCGSRHEVETVERFNATPSAPAPGAGAAGQGMPGPGMPTVPGMPGVPRGTDAAPGAPAPGSREAGNAWRESTPAYVDRGEIPQMQTLVCNSCGAEIVADPTTISTRCGFCNNTFVASERIRNTRIPDFIIPFAIDKAGMLDSFKKATRGKFLLPKEFRDRHTLEEATGAYIPYWYHDGTTSGTIVYTAENTRTWSDNEYDYTETDIYEVTREVSAAFTGIPVCATTKLGPKRSEGVEPFSLEESKPFATPYLSGYAATAYDIEARATIARADERVKATVSSLVSASVTGYSSVRQRSAMLSSEHSAIWYALLPVWLIVIAYNGKTYPFAINGQTGEVVGSFPISQGKLRALRVAFAAFFFIVFGAIAWLVLGWLDL